MAVPSKSSTTIKMADAVKKEFLFKSDSPPVPSDVVRVDGPVMRHSKCKNHAKSKYGIVFLLSYHIEDSAQGQNVFQGKKMPNPYGTIFTDDIYRLSVLYRLPKKRSNWVGVAL